jgi:hypothetical protein
MADGAEDSWEQFASRLEKLRVAIRRSGAVNVNASSLREEARAVVQQFFRTTRPDLLGLGFDPTEIAPLDEEMQSLLQLSHGRNAKASYARVLEDTRKFVQQIEIARELRLGQARQTSASSLAPPASRIESQILETLERLSPTAARSYEQALRDLSADRASYRGTANELREAFRETLDVLAPDDEVASAEGFKLEAGQTKPTQRQKVRHILSSRGIGKTARRTPETAVSLVEELTGSLARATYERGSLSTHLASTAREVRQMKMYIDSVLAELLEIH